MAAVLFPGLITFHCSLLMSQLFLPPHTTLVHLELELWTNTGVTDLFTYGGVVKVSKGFLFVCFCFCLFVYLITQCISVAVVPFFTNIKKIES